MSLGTGQLKINFVILYQNSNFVLGLGSTRTSPTFSGALGTFRTPDQRHVGADLFSIRLTNSMQLGSCHKTTANWIEPQKCSSEEVSEAEEEEKVISLFEASM